MHQQLPAHLCDGTAGSGTASDMLAECATSATLMQAAVVPNVLSGRHNLSDGWHPA